MKKLLCVAAMAAFLGAGHASAQVIDGSRTSAGDNYGSPIVLQTVQTQFGDAMPGTGGSELDAAYAYTDGTNLYLMLTGNLESNFNKLMIFIDSQGGGENVITADVNNGGNNPTNDNWANQYAGFTFDAGFTADYLLICRNGNFGGDRFDLDFNSVGTDAVLESDTDLFGGSLEGSDGMLANGICVGFDNSNDAGIFGGTQAADPVLAAAVETGIELKIPLSEINASVGDTIKISAHINSSNLDFMSNQFLAGLLPDQGNLGGDGDGNFTGNVGGIDLTTFDDDQCFEYTIQTAQPEVISPDSDNVIGTVLGGSVEDLAESDNVDYRLSRNSSDLQARIILELKGTTTIQSPSNLEFTLEAGAFARGPISQTIELFDYDLGDWEELDMRDASRFGDSTVTVIPTGDLARFVDDATGCIEARISWRSSTPRASFSASPDFAEWFIEP